MSIITNEGEEFQKQPRSKAELDAAIQEIIDTSPDIESGLKSLAAFHTSQGLPVPEAIKNAIGLLPEKNSAVASQPTQNTENEPSNSKKETENTNKEPSIKIHKKSTMKKLSEPDVAKLHLEDLGEDETQALYPAHDDETGKDFFILKRTDSAFALPEDHPMIQQAQLEVASTIINGIQTRSVIDRAGAIQAALRDHNFSFKGGPIDLLRFAVDAMNVVIDFEKTQSKMRMMDIHQAGLLQLQEDMGANILAFNLLPAHRKMNVALLSQVIMIRDAEELMTDKTSLRSEEMKNMNKNLEEMKKETRSMWMESAQEAISRTVDTTTGAGRKLITDLVGGITEVSADALTKLQSFALGEESIDKGTVNALLDSMGSLGTKLRTGAKESGVDLVEFFKSFGAKKPESTELDPQ